MDPTIALSDASRFTAGVLLLTVLAVESGGLYMLALVRKRLPATPFQMTFSRAGHAHAGVLVILSLVAQLYVDAVAANGLIAGVARNGIPTAAILMPAGYFFSSMGAGRTEPSRWIWLVYLGAISLGAGALALGLLLLGSR